MSEAQSDNEIVKSWAKKNAWWIGIVFVVLCLIPFVPATLVLLFSKGHEWRVLNPNEFGDSFGFLNSMMSSFAFFGVLYTVFLQDRQLRKQDQQLDMQREELGLQREEMKESRAELKRSADAQKEMIEMQLCQSYLSCLTTALSHGSGIEAHGEVSEFKHLRSVQRIIDRWEENVMRIVAKQPFDLGFFYDQLSPKFEEILLAVQGGQLVDARKASYALMKWLTMWEPGLKRMDSELGRIVSEQLNVLLFEVHQLSDKIDTIAFQDLASRLAQMRAELMQFDLRDFEV